MGRLSPRLPIGSTTGSGWWIDGESWPVCQDLAAEPTEEDTFEVDYMKGFPVPAGGQIAAGMLICQLSRAVCGEKCDLPMKASSVSRQGVSMTFDLQPGETGLFLVDDWVKTANKGGARVLTPEKYYRQPGKSRGRRHAEEKPMPVPTQCFNIVRGKVLRVTVLDECGAILPAAPPPTCEVGESSPGANGALRFSGDNSVVHLGRAEVRAHRSLFAVDPADAGGGAGARGRRASVAGLDRRRQPRFRADARPRPALLRADSFLARQRDRGPRHARAAVERVVAADGDLRRFEPRRRHPAVSRWRAARDRGGARSVDQGHLVSAGGRRSSRETPPLTLAARFRDSGFKNGLIDDLQVFDVELTAVEVAACPPKRARYGAKEGGDQTSEGGSISSRASISRTSTPPRPSGDCVSRPTRSSPMCRRSW